MDMDKGRAMAIVSVVGLDRVGIIAKVSTALAKCGANILDLSQTVMREYFTMIMLVDLSGANVPFAAIKEELDGVGREIDMQIRIQREDIFNAMHRL